MSFRPPKDAGERARLLAHRGLATWGEQLVPLDNFRAAAKLTGRELDPVARARERAAFLAPRLDPTPVEGPFRRIAVCGGVYSNHVALAVLLAAAREKGAEAVYCLGDLGGFGPNPDRVWPMLEHAGVRVIQGNYEESLASGREDCNCGYTDPRDNHFAAISYGYTARHTAPGFKAWMGTLPTRRRVHLGERELLLVHGSPRRVNEFLFASTCPDGFLEVLLDEEHADAVLCTHSGLHWHRRLPSGRDLVNVGVLGRPANDGTPRVWYAMLSAVDSAEEPDRAPAQTPDATAPRPTRTAPRGGIAVELCPLDYDHAALADEMRSESLPDEFVATVLSGWWTTCLEILPARERAASRF